ncbi:MAG: response regulator, partial [Flavobacteriales bacterium]
NENDARNFHREIEKSSLKVALTIVPDVEEMYLEVKKQSFNIIFSDYHLPGQNGLSFLRNLRSREINIPVVFITDYADPQIAVEMMQSGASDFIPKSLLNSDGIEQCVRNSIRYSELENQRKNAELHLKSAEDKLSTVISFTPIIIFSFDKNGEITLAKGTNLGFSDDIIGESIFVVFEGKKEFTNQAKIALAGNEVTQSMNFGNLVYQITCTPRFDEHGELVEVIGIANDITKRAEAEDSLMKAKILAEQTSKAKQDFIANMSHEIRTPMNAIVGFTGLLEETNLNDVQKDYVHTIKVSGENLLNLINDILDFSKIEAGKLFIEKESFVLHNVLDAIERVLKGKASEKSLDFFIEVAPNVPRYIIGDSNRLYQVLMNLVGNAIKFTDKGFVKIKVEKSWEKEDRFRLKFFVIDSGIGIPKNKLDYIFESFNQVSSGATRKYGGTGLGLSIVKKLVELQKGTVKASSKVGEGSVFEFEIKYKLDLTQQPEKEGEVVNIDFNLLEGKTILLAEDNRMNQKFIINIFEKTPAKLFVASDGEEAIQMMKEKDFDILLLDIQMPNKDGFEVIKELRNTFSSPKKNIPVIAMTAHAFKEERDACIAAGMNEHIAKPIHKDDLFALIYEYLFGKKISNAASPSMLDVNYLKNISEGNDEFVKEMLGIFYEDTPPLIKKLQEAVQEHDYKRIMQLAHKYRSPLALLGLKELEESMKLIEYKAKQENDIEIIREEVNKSVVLTEKVLSEVKFKLE